ncbi:FAD-dependent oxidoreductase [Agrobacterium sp. CCNWLW71]|uniref:NAD(P)/FAD-dependent oxidoreductase n=1 Tax=unclassified Agrobacterium TaxID=2632611 RepID=UPI002FF1E217
MIVIGAGIISSAITYNLSMDGADVLLLDGKRMAGAGVTGRAFGWINVINGTPGDRSYALWQQATAGYRKLIATFPSTFASVRRGSLLWKETPQDTERFAELHQRAGERVELLKHDALRVLEPNLRQVPDLAPFAPDDLALDPQKLAQDLVAAASDARGKVRFGVTVTAIETENGRVSGVWVGDKKVEADIVVLSAGTGIHPLTNALGIETGIKTSPVLVSAQN